jgi:hypothetical protein
MKNLFLIVASVILIISNILYAGEITFGTTDNITVKTSANVSLAYATNEGCDGSTCTDYIIGGANSQGTNYYAVTSGYQGYFQKVGTNVLGDEIQLDEFVTSANAGTESALGEGWETR